MAYMKKNKQIPICIETECMIKKDIQSNNLSSELINCFGIYFTIYKNVF